MRGHVRVSVPSSQRGVIDLVQPRNVADSVEQIMPGGPGSKDLTKMLNLNVVQNNDDSDDDQAVESDYDDEFLKNNSFENKHHSHD